MVRESGRGFRFCGRRVLPFVLLVAGIGCAEAASSGGGGAVGDDGSSGGTGGIGGFAGKGTRPPDTRPIVTAPVRPPPLSGGTLIALDNGRAVMSDPDRDRIVTVDLTTETSTAIALDAGTEPGRLVADDSGLVHVALRGTGEVATVDLVAGAVVRRQSVCRAPRGMLFDAEHDAIIVACLEGTLVELPAAGGEPLRTTEVAPDLRDVVLLGGTLVVTRFRSAEILWLDAERNITKRATPLAGDPQFSATTAWRAVVSPDGELVITHQRALETDIDIGGGGTGGTTADPPVSGTGGSGSSSSGYGAAFDPCSSIVQGTITTVSPEGAVVTHATLMETALPVDVAVSPQGMVAVANGAFDPLQSSGSATSFTAVERRMLTNGAANCGSSVAFNDFLNPVVAVAFTSDGRLLTQSREPAELWVYDPVDGQGYPPYVHQIPLGGANVTDTGYSLFHSDTGNGIACASCHAEGTDDGHVWNFLGLGGRRTQPLDVGLEGSAPFHWDGTLPSFGDLVHEVFQRRMGAQEQSPERAGALERYIYGFRRRPGGLFEAEAAARGQLLFESAEVGCAECHSGPKFTNGLSESIGKGNAMQVPSLVAVAARAPYMHDGCAATLRDRFDPACGGTRHGNTAGLSQAELGDLVEYLESL